MSEQQSRTDTHSAVPLIAPPAGAEQTGVAPHLVRLGGEDWALWRSVGLRSAGFPAAQVLKLALPFFVLAVEEMLEAEEAAERLRQKTERLIERELNASAGEQRALLKRAIQSVQKGKPPKVVPYSVGETCARWQAAVAGVAAHRAGLPEKFAAGLRRQSQVLYELIGSERFCEALIWQNRRAYDRGVASLARRAHNPFRRGFKQRQNEELVASYLQRYCVKNDTIGFFGPVGWARLAPDSRTDARPGPELKASSSVYFEGWCVDALAEKIAANPAIRPWLAPRRLPYIHVEGANLYVPGAAPTRLPATHAAALTLCDGARTAKQIAALLLKAGVPGASSAEDVYRVLEYFLGRGLISWTLTLPPDSHPERTLRRLLERVEDDALRRRALSDLDALEEARTRVSLASGHASRLNEAMQAFESEFTRLTGSPATRAAGETYAARTLVYEDCRRDIEVNIGAEVIEGLRAPLSLLLTSARWFTHEAAEAFKTIFRDAFEELSRASGSTAVGFVNFWTRVEPLLMREKTHVFVGIERKFQERWAGVLGRTPATRRLAYRSADLRERVGRQFAAPRSGWRFARYHSPDVMVAAESVEAIRRGEFQLVLGELHMATNTLRSSFFVSQHPDASELYEALERDFPEPRVVPVLPKNFARSTARTALALVSPKDYRLESALDTPSGADGSKVLPMGSLVVEDAPGGLRVRTRDGRLGFDILEFFGEILSSQAVNHFNLLAPAAHTPRVSIDRLVVSRETWRFAPEQLSFASERDPLDRFVGARRLRRRRSLPNHVFVKVASEVKPFYVDFDSPVLVEALAKAARRAAGRGEAVSVSEMLPGPGQWWLADSEGRRYTSELRLIALDLAGEATCG